MLQCDSRESGALFKLRGLVTTSVACLSRKTAVTLAMMIATSVTGIGACEAPSPDMSDHSDPESATVSLRNTAWHLTAMLGQGKRWDDRSREVQAQSIAQKKTLDLAKTSLAAQPWSDTWLVAVQTWCWRLFLVVPRSTLLYIVVRSSASVSRLFSGQSPSLVAITKCEAHTCTFRYD